MWVEGDVKESHDREKGKLKKIRVLEHLFSCFPLLFVMVAGAILYLRHWEEI
jgi:hypothetical protein